MTAVPSALHTFLVVQNDGPYITWTNYWESPLAAQGGLYCSINAGAVRLLMPPALNYMVAEMRTAREVLVTRGPWPEAGTAEALELLWEDGSNAPFFICLGRQQLERFIARTDAGRQIACHAYTGGAAGVPLLAGSWPARFRVARSLPYLRPWGK